MSEEERLQKAKEMRQAWYEKWKRQVEPSPTSTRSENESPLDLKTKPSPKLQQSSNTYDTKRIRIIEDKIIHKAPLTYVPPNLYIENNYYEPISPPETINISDSVPNTDTCTEATTTVQDEVIDQQIEEYHVVTHDQYLEYLKLKKHFENTQDETTESNQDTNEPENENNDIQKNIPSFREKRIQELIGMSDEYKNYILSILNKVNTSDISRNIMKISLLAKFRMIQQQKSLDLIQNMGKRVNAAVATNSGQEDVHIVKEGVNVPTNVPNEIHNNPLLNVGNELPHSQMMHADLNAMHFPNVPYVSQAPPKYCLQNEQEAVQTKTNHRNTVFPSDQQQFLPHTYSNKQQSFPNTFVPSAQRLSMPVTQSDQQQVYSNTDVPNFPQPRWNNSVIPSDNHQTYLQKAVPSPEIQTYLENEINPIILTRQQKVPKPVILSDHQHIEQNIPGGRIRYPNRVVLNNQQQIFSDPDELSSEYCEPAVLHYQPQNYNEPVFPSDQQHSYPEGIVPNFFERDSRRSRHQSPYHEQLISGQHKIYSNGVSQNIEQIRCPEPYAIKNPQQIEKRPQQQRYRGLVPPESQQQYPTPVISTSQHPRYYNPSDLNGQLYRHHIPSAPYAQHQASLETKQKKQPKRQYQRRKDTSQKQHPASLRRQHTNSSPTIQTHPAQQHAVPLRMIRRTMQPPIVSEVPNQTIHPIPEQVPEYYQQYYNQHPENQNMYRDQNYHHPYEE